MILEIFRFRSRFDQYLDISDQDLPLLRILRDQGFLTSAIPSDQALALLKDVTPAERDILGAIPYQENNTVLHADARILPKQRWIRASWNYLIPKVMKNRAVLTYDMNILQTLQASREFCVTLNASDAIVPASIKARSIYQRRVFTTWAPEVQKRPAEISGIHRTHFCGPREPLETAVRCLVAAKTGKRPSGPIRMLSHFRYFCHCFNPASFFRAAR